MEDALKMEIPLNAQLIRNLILIAHGLHDHIVHSYYLSALDWVDILQVLKADPGEAAALTGSLSPWPHNSKNEMKAAQDKIKAVAARGQLGIFANGYSGHPATKLSPEVNDRLGISQQKREVPLDFPSSGGTKKGTVFDS